MSEFEKSLETFRTEIDGLDDKIVELLNQRAKIVEKVGELKATQKDQKCIIRPGREATMVRRVVKLGKGKFPKAALAGLWRTIIAGSCSIEENLKVSVYAPENNSDYYWLAREYFGPFTPITRHPSIGRIISDVSDGRASVGVVPLPQDTEEQWWYSIADGQPRWPSVFAKIPFIEPKTSRGMHPALAFGMVNPEPTGDDYSLVVIRLADSVSRARLSTALTKAGLNASLLAPAALDGNVDVRSYVFEVPEFLEKDNPKLKKVAIELGKSAIAVQCIGTYATPMKF